MVKKEQKEKEMPLTVDELQNNIKNPSMKNP